jgi:hypothetical protein
MEEGRMWLWEAQEFVVVIYMVGIVCEDGKGRGEN